MNKKLSIILLTHNDEDRIVDTIECLNFADELVVVDDNSTDRTLDLVRQYTPYVYSHTLNHNFAAQRNYALNHAHGEWVLFIDSDEIVTEKLREEILRAIKSTRFNSYYLKRIDLMWGRKILHGEVGQVRLLRLAKKGMGRWYGKVHETWRVRTQSGNLSSPLLHMPHQSVSQFIRDIDEYSTLRAEELSEKGQKTNAFLIVLYPLSKLVLNYFIRKGYRDGIPGLLYAIIMSFHSFLVRGKLYLLTNSK